jgi:hypothetical protein
MEANKFRQTAFSVTGDGIVAVTTEFYANRGIAKKISNESLVLIH